MNLSDADDPSAILDALPAKYHRPFLDDLDDAPGDACQLRIRMNLWRLRAIVFSTPGFDEAATKARTARDEDLFPLPWESPH